MNERKYVLVSPSIPQDIETLIQNSKFYFHYLPITKIVVIGNEKVNELIKDIPGLFFLNENQLVSFNDVKSIIKRELGENETKRTGWYVQQFIKIAYALICKDEYYLIWDSDTIPTKHHVFFNDENKPFFDLKKEYNKSYFDTIATIFPDCRKIIKASFISEHMLIKKELMMSMITAIEKNDKIPGNNFIEKILCSVSISNKLNSKFGFSEFETFGTYVSNYYPEFYAYRKWHSLRYGGFFYTPQHFNKDLAEWLAFYYDAITFEKYHHLSRICRLNFHDYIYPRCLEFISLVIRIKRRIFTFFSNRN